MVQRSRHRVAPPHCAQAAASRQRRVRARMPHPPLCALLLGPSAWRGPPTRRGDPARRLRSCEGSGQRATRRGQRAAGSWQRQTDSPPFCDGMLESTRARSTAQRRRAFWTRFLWARPLLRHAAAPPNTSRTPQAAAAATHAQGRHGATSAAHARSTPPRADAERAAGRRPRRRAYASAPLALTRPHASINHPPPARCAATASTVRSRAPPSKHGHATGVARQPLPGDAACRGA